MSSEYRTIVSCINHLEIALKSPERTLVNFLHHNGFISEEIHHDVLNPRTMLTDHQKAGQLVDRIKTQVKLSPQKFHEFINFLHDNGKQYKSLVTILSNEYNLQEQGNVEVNRSRPFTRFICHTL